MSFWDRLSKYRTHGPQAVGGLALQPPDVFRRVLGEAADEVLLPLGWARGKGLEWFRPCQNWADQVIELQPLRSAVGARWGLRLSFVPPLKKKRGGTRHLDLSYDPLDYEKDRTPWTISQFATEEELRTETQALMRRALAEVEALSVCCRDLRSLVRCFEEKKMRKYIGFGFQDYPNEVLAYATLLGLVGRENEALQEIEAAFTRLKASDAEQERFRRALQELWQEGVAGLDRSETR